MRLLIFGDVEGATAKEKESSFSRNKSGTRPQTHKRAEHNLPTFRCSSMRGGGKFVEHDSFNVSVKI